MAGVAALLPVTALASGTQPKSAAPPASFAPPRAGLILTREVRRPLPDGKEIVSRRSYEIHIVREGDSFRVDGRLVASEVAAPPSLRAFAELERNRPDDGMFPIMLDTQGMIQTASTPADGKALRTATETVSMWVAKSKLGPDDRDEVAGFLRLLKSRGGTGRAQWPRDLFRPAVGLRSETSHFDLADGDQGSVTVATDAKALRGDGLLESVERTVITELAGSQHITREMWRLDNLKGDH
jgi:hypothetical protein